MQLQQAVGNLSRGLYDANKTVYSLLKYGAKVSESPEKPPVTVEFIDEENPLNNDFAIAEEVTVVEQSEKRPDLVVYLNGIAVAVIELKRSSISVSEGIRQNLTNQKDMFISGFFATMQFCMAGNESEEYVNDHKNIVLVTVGAVYQRDPAILALFLRGICA